MSKVAATHSTLKILRTILIATLATFAGCGDPVEETKELVQVLEGWEIETHPHGLNINPRDLLFLDAETGFIVGFNGDIYKTTDGGDSWQEKNSGTNLHLFSVSFINMQKGFIAGEGMNCISGDCGRGAVFLSSSDGGETWTKRFFPEYLGFYDLHFFDELQGIAMITIPNQLETSDYVIGRTADGGESWTLTELPVQLYSHFQVVEGVAFAVAEYQQIIKTVDAGKTWTGIPIPMEPSNEVRSIYFYNENIGFVDGVTDLFRTTDGGVNWQISSLPFGSMHVFHSYDEHESFNVQGISEYEGGDFPQFKGSVAQRTTDGGAAWTTSEISENLMLGLTVFPSRELGYSLNGRDFYTISRKQ